MAMCRRNTRERDRQTRTTRLRQPEVGRFSLYVFGVEPVQRLKAWWNVLVLEKPISYAAS